MQPEYLIVGLLGAIAFLLMRKQSQPTLVVQRPIHHQPFYHHLMGVFRRQHRFHGGGYRHH